MKLIIDIPEKVVTAIQNGEDYRYDIHTSIAQGIPYEEMPQGDLISREALKKSFAVITYIRFTADMGQGRYEMFSEKEIEDIIDKVQAVSPERPQGEWIDTGSGQECNVCHEIQYGYDNFRHFCANCGAKMKGGAE